MKFILLPPLSPPFPAAFRQNLGGIPAVFAIPKKNNFLCILSLFVWFDVGLEHSDVHLFIAGRKALFFNIIFLVNCCCYKYKKISWNAAFLPDSVLHNQWIVKKCIALNFLVTSKSSCSIWFCRCSMRGKGKAGLKGGVIPLDNI